MDIERPVNLARTSGHESDYRIRVTGLYSIWDCYADNILIPCSGYSCFFFFSFLEEATGSGHSGGN